MKTLYIECNMGAAGDMLLAALSEIAPEEGVRKVLDLGVQGVTVEFHPMVKCGIQATHAQVLVGGVEEESLDAAHEHEHEHHHHHEHGHDHAHEHGDHDHHDHDHDHNHDHHHHHHEHHGMADIKAMIEQLDVSDKVKQDALAIYGRIAEAESRVHGEPVDQIHFHEVGAMDAVADVVGACVLMEAIGAERIVVSPVNTGSGHVHCAHGVLPVPAPATAMILEDVPNYSDGTNGELCTPTGAAILAHFASEFGPRPVMKIVKTGYGAGKKDFAKANLLRVFLGDTESAGKDTAVELAANIDDMTGEELGFAMDRLLEAGALDVYYTSIQMKKNRPAVKLSCIVRPEDGDRIAEVMFRYTTTAGIRRTELARYTLERSIRDEDGIRIKEYEGYGVRRVKVEYDDLEAKALQEGRTLSEVREAVRKDMK